MERIRNEVLHVKKKKLHIFGYDIFFISIFFKIHEEIFTSGDLSVYFLVLITDLRNLKLKEKNNVFCS